VGLSSKNILLGFLKQIFCYPFSGIFIPVLLAYEFHVYVFLDDILFQQRLGNLAMV